MKERRAEMEFWTDKKLALLKKYVEAGDMSFSEIARKLCCTRSAAIGKARRAGFKQPPIPRVIIKQKAAETRRQRHGPSKPRTLSANTPSAAPVAPPAPKAKPPVSQAEISKKITKLFGPKRRVRLPVELQDEEAFKALYLDVKAETSSAITNIPGRLSCKWITGDVKGGDAKWCRAPVHKMSSWCAKHFALVYYAGKV